MGCQYHSSRTWFASTLVLMISATVTSFEVRWEPICGRPTETEEDRLIIGYDPRTVILVRAQAANGAVLSSRLMISSRVRSGIGRTARWMPTSRYSARAALSAGAPNTLIDSVEKSRPAADAT